MSPFVKLVAASLCVAVAVGVALLGRTQRETAVEQQPVTPAVPHPDAVANPASGWELDLRIPEADVRHVLQAKTNSESPLEISYALETTPDLSLSTTLAKISAGTEVDEFGRLSTSATAVPENASLQNARPGAGVVAQIHCGQRAVGFVLFRRIIEAIQRRWWL